MKYAHWFTVIVISLFAGQAAMAIEEPEFELLASTDAYEIRHYAPYIVAEVDVDGDMKEAGNSAFRILAGYIFGDNEPGTKMSMTAPVTTRPADSGERMQMTAPVLSTSSGEGGETYTYAFVMESRYSMETLPKPLDPRIRLVEKAATIVAARRYSGSWSQRNYTENETALLNALAEDGVTLSGQPYLARYNSPFTPWFMRRNELLVEIEKPTDM